MLKDEMAERPEFFLRNQAGQGIGLKSQLPYDDNVQVSFHPSGIPTAYID
jgi:hypothetical protein